MKFYADLPARRTCQIVADVFALCWVAVSIWAGRTVDSAILALRGPTDTMVSAGSSFQNDMASAASTLSKVPFVGDSLRGPFDSLTNTGQQVSAAGTSLGQTVDRLALTAGLVVAIVPIVVVLAVWATLRIRFVRRATVANRFVASPGALELFALRALANARVDQLGAISADPAGAWRARDLEAVHALAMLELRSYGLEPARIGPAA